MQKYLLKHTYTIIMLCVAILFAIYMTGYHKTSYVAGLMMACIFITRDTYKSEKADRAYEAGLCIGIASIIWIWALAAFLLFLVYLYGPMKVSSKRMFWASLIGLLTPFWCCLPFWIFSKILYITTMIREVSETIL
jgi:hypothetical protein